MTNRLLRLKQSFAAGMMLFSLLTAAGAGTIAVTGDPADYAINLTNGVSGQTAVTLRAGANASAPAGGRNTVLIFQLPAIGNNVVLTDAQLNFHVTAIRTVIRAPMPPVSTSLPATTLPISQF